MRGVQKTCPVQKRNRGLENTSKTPQSQNRPAASKGLRTGLLKRKAVGRQDKFVGELSTNCRAPIQRGAGVTAQNGKRAKMGADNLGFLTGLLILLHLTVSVATVPPCVTRRCLSEELIHPAIRSQPQTDSCNVNVFLQHIVYQTVDVDTKKLLFTSTLKMLMLWEDPALAWNTSVYPYDKVMLPVTEVWTPHLYVKNAITTVLDPNISDVMVFSNGSVAHQILMHVTVGCDINLFAFPYTGDSCPVYLDGRTPEGCGSIITIGTIVPKGIERGDWRTDSVEDITDPNGYTYLWVTMSIRSFNPTVTLVLPSVLIMLADMASFSLPLGGGERISFKVTLVLSFVMFLVILSGTLTGDSLCSPLIRYHFCLCLVSLVVTMIQSMLLIRLAADGSLLPFRCRTRGGKPPSPEGNEAPAGAIVYVGTNPDCVVNHLEF
ncbi:hypothetical protein AAFF_G00323690 [Aldrovandia affinis]|uniref:Neurotransmitter-gated ion-channel ligand-binding domain-containing protein n=1 Tax=Aldrovandia affinis TaxID=143900 RepID=A0AAD7W0A4_9TELE|nr:hypothetical protein AAFF_G00323690 [Aldrovandia affinis]